METTEAGITHYQIQVKIKGIPYFTNPIREAITEQNLLELANHGTTPDQGRISPVLRDRAARIKAALLAGRRVETASATILPLTRSDYASGRLTPETGSERI